MSRWLGLVLGLLALGLSPSAGAQVVANASLDGGTLVAGRGALLDLPIENPTQRPYVVIASSTQAPGVHATVTPPRVRLEANASFALSVLLEADARADAGPRALEVVLTTVDAQTGDTREHRVEVALKLVRPPTFLGVFQAPLPRPLDSTSDILVAELAVWVLAAAIAFTFAHAREVRRAGRGRAGVLERSGGPLAVLILAAGTRASLRLAPASPFVTFADRGLALLAVVLAAFLAHRVVTTLLGLYAARRDGTRGPADLVIPILEKIVGVAIALLAVAYTFQVLGIDVGFLLAGGVVVGLVLSLAAQDTLSNLFSGFFILFDRPFREGDEIRLATGEVCRVDHIGLRSTKLYHFRHEQQMVVPNNELASKRVTNMSYPDTTYRLSLRVDVAHGTDLRAARETLVRVARATPNVIDEPGREPIVWLREFNESGIETQLRVYIPSSRHRNPVRTALIMGIRDAFDEAGIVIPVPQRDVLLRLPRLREQEEEE